MEKVIKVTRKYQVTIPKEVRTKVGVEIGDELKIMNRGDLIVLKKVGKRRNLLDFAGCWKGYPENLDEFMMEIRRLWSTWKVQGVYV